MHSCLTLSTLSLPIHIGWSDEERSIAQEVLLDIIIEFTKLPPACETDNLSDTVCYDTLVNDIQQFCHGKTFHLLENLCCQLYHRIKNKISLDTRIQITATKQSPMPQLHRSSFTIDGR